MNPFLSEKSRGVVNAALFRVYRAPCSRGEGQAQGISHGSIPCSQGESVHLSWQCAHQGNILLPPPLRMRY